MNDHPSWAENAVLIYGPRKAGTTLLLNLLDGSNELVVNPVETKLKFIARDLDGDHLQIARLRALKGGDFTAAGLIPWPDTTLQQHIFAIYQSMAVRPRRPRRWVMKEVGGNAAQVIGLFRKIFPAGKTIMITRDAKMISRSVYRDRRRRGVRLPLRKLWKEAFDPIRVLDQQNAFRGKPGFHFVSYERLVGGHLRDEMKAIAEFLDIAFTEAFERPTVFGRSVIVATASRKSREVFATAGPWTDGLLLLEKACIRLSHLVV